MKLLLDTHVYMWLVLEPEKLSREATQAIGDPDNELFLSVASLWEAAVKVSIGKLRLPGDTIQALLDELADDVDLVALFELAPGLDLLIRKSRKRRSKRIESHLISRLHCLFEVGADRILKRHAGRYARRLRAAADFFLRRTLGFS